MSTLDYARPQTRLFGLLEPKTQRRVFLLTLFASDLLALALASALAYAFRFWLNLEIFDAGDPSLTLYLPMTALLIPWWILLFFQYRLYDLHYLLGGTHEYALILNASTLGMMSLIIVFFFSHVVIARGWIVLFWIFSIVVVGLFRFGLRGVA